MPLVTDSLPHPAPNTSALPTIEWSEAGQPCSALWRSERGSPAPKKVVLADDTLSADTAYRLACEGTGLLWRGDFHNARMLLQALARRSDRLPERQKFKAHKSATKRLKSLPASPAVAPGHDPAEAFHQHRMAQAQRARILAMVLIPFNADYTVPLRRAPDVREACSQVWGTPTADTLTSVASLRELMGMTSSHEWRKKGVEIPALGIEAAATPDSPETYHRIHPHYGVFSPVRGEYLVLAAKAPLPVSAAPKATMVAFDIGTGTGVLAAVLAQRGVHRIVATDQDARALVCAQDNINRLGYSAQVQIQKTDLFPEGKAHLIVCNPPWLPARASSALEHAVYDEGSGMLLGFLNGLAAHLAKGGEGWLIMSDLAERLGLRQADELENAISAAGLRVITQMSIKPTHPKAADTDDALHQARAGEITSLWRLAVA